MKTIPNRVYLTEDNCRRYNIATDMPTVETVP